jgi:signal transduction histidine kinase
MHPVQLQNARILVVDDEVANTWLMTNILSGLGYSNLDSLSDPTLFLQRVESFQPDLILLDLTMPGLDGFRLLEMLHQNVPANAWIPVLVITAVPTAANKRRALAAGAADLLGKPFDAAEMNMRIRSILEARISRLKIEELNRQLEDRVQERTLQLQRALEDIRAAQRQMLQQQRLTAFGEMADGVVHDFSNTLMAVIGYSEMLICNEGKLLDDKEKALDYLRIINSEGRGGAEVVSRLRDFYRPHVAADLFVAVDLNAIAEQAILLTRPKWKDASRVHSARIHLETHFGAVPLVHGNAVELRDTLTNLIFNAVDAMPGGGTLSVRTQAEDGQATIEVADTGSGMTPEVRARCFDPFFSTKGDAGTGLGLAMVFGTVTRHQGTVQIVTGDARGTAFRILLPGLSAAPGCEFVASAN